MTSNIIKSGKWKIKKWLFNHLPACKTLVPLMSESLERPLTLRERVKLKLHMMICVWCERYMKQITQLQEASQLKAESILTDETPALSDDARERLKQNLKQQFKN